MKNILKSSIKENKYRLIVCMIFIGINMFLFTIPPKVIGELVDLLYNIDLNKNIIISKIIYLVLVCTLVVIVRLIWKYFDTYIPRKFEKNLRDNLFSYLLKIKMSEIQSRKNGELMTYFVKDINEFRAAVYNVLSFGSRIIFTMIFAIFSMAQNVDLRLTIIALIPLFVGAIISAKIRKKMDESYIESQESYTELSEYIQESTDAIRTTKAYHGEDEQIKHFIHINKKVKNSNYKVSVYSGLLTACINTCFGLSYGLTILFGTRLVLNGTISIGSFIAFIAYIALFIDPVSWIPQVFSRYRRGKVSYDRLSGVFKIATETYILIEKSDEENIKLLNGDIVIKNLTYSYPDFIETALDDINVVIRRGETVGIIGRIGSGKTTLMNLLVKLYPVNRDKIYINGIDINDIPVEILRENICYITQDSFLFSATLKHNINLFRDEYTDEDIEKSIREAIIYDEIMSLPENINTVIGERGVDLSGGQKQRVSISRAFLNNSDIVIFDDTFSALDNKTEKKLIKNVKKLVKDKTCIIVSNRISDIKHADKIIVMDDGKIVQIGTHEELLRVKGMYNNFYEQQIVKSSEGILN